MKLSSDTKYFLIKFFLAGGIYAVLMAGFTYYEDDKFSIWRFIFNFIFFGGFMGYFSLREKRRNTK